MRSTGLLVLAGVAGVAQATPAAARDPIPSCPAMPTSSDLERSSSGGLSLGTGGLSLGGDRSKTSSERDVMARTGGFEAWSAAVVLSHACQAERAIHKGDLARQRDELIALRERLLGRTSSRAYVPTRAALAPSSDVGSRSFTWDQLWLPLSTAQFVPYSVRPTGRRSVSATLDCLLRREDGLSDCRVVDEQPIGLGVGSAVTRYAESLQLVEDARQIKWSARRVTKTLTISISN